MATRYPTLAEGEALEGEVNTAYLLASNASRYVKVSNFIVCL